MHHPPSVDELMRAVELMLDEQFVPTLDGARKYNARVASNVIKMIRRELRDEERQLDAEWRGLDVLLGPEQRPATLEGLRQATRSRNEVLVERIREGDADVGEFRARILAHVRDVVHAKLEVSNPGWLEGDAGL
jgi:hypothetical protein